MARVFAVIGVLSLLLAPLWLNERARQRRASDERRVGSALKELSNAQAQYRETDLDGNGVQDFWTGDVAGLYGYGLIGLDVARADLAPLTPLSSTPVPADGYFFRALLGDEAGAYGDGSRFGFVAIPVDPAMPVVMINQWNSLKAWRVGWPGTLRWPGDAEMKRYCSNFG